MQDMAGLVEHVMINKLNDDLDSAITFAGGDTSGVTNIMQYPQIIREQLGSGNIPTSKSIILEGDSCIITSSPEGWDEYNTDYASGRKTGLDPNTMYVRICTAVKDIEPVYISLTPVTDKIGTGGVDIDDIVNKVVDELDLSDILNSDELVNKIESTVSEILGGVDVQQLQSDVQTLQNTQLTNADVENLISNSPTIQGIKDSVISDADVRGIVQEEIGELGSDDAINIEDLDW